RRHENGDRNRSDISAKVVTIADTQESREVRACRKIAHSSESAQSHPGKGARTPISEFWQSTSRVPSFDRLTGRMRGNAGVDAGAVQRGLTFTLGPLAASAHSHG